MCLANGDDRSEIDHLCKFLTSERALRDGDHFLCGGDRGPRRRKDDLHHGDHGRREREDLLDHGDHRLRHRNLGLKDQVNGLRRASQSLWNQILLSKVKPIFGTSETRYADC